MVWPTSVLSRLSACLISMLLIVYGSFRSLNMEREARERAEREREATLLGGVPAPSSGSSSKSCVNFLYHSSSQAGCITVFSFCSDLKCSFFSNWPSHFDFHYSIAALVKWRYKNYWKIFRGAIKTNTYNSCFCPVLNKVMGTYLYLSYYLSSVIISAQVNGQILKYIFWCSIPWPLN